MLFLSRPWLESRLRYAWATFYKLRHRAGGYSLLSGSGLEIGAFYLPARLNSRCNVKYADAISRQDALLRFPELKDLPLVDVDYILDIDRGDFSRFSDETLDFVIMNHVIEHLANPIQALEDLIRIIRSGGHVVITAPDKEYGSDRLRELTTFDHLEGEYRSKVSTVSDDHYLDFLRGVMPEVFKREPQEIQEALSQVRERREHAHVWNSMTFKAFLTHAFKDVLGVPMKLCYESTGAENRNEYFSVWEKGFCV